MAKIKKDLDKDLLFKKIMPALADNPFTAISNVPEPESEAPSEESALSALRSKIFAREQDRPELAGFVTINLMENLVLKHLDTVIHKFNTCSCDRCRCDIAAYALNLLPAKYVVIRPGNISAREEDIPTKPVMDALLKQ